MLNNNPSNYTDFNIDEKIIARLDQSPQEILTSSVNGQKYSINFVIPDYKLNINNYYREQINSVAYSSEKNKFPPLINNFGLCIKFDTPTEIQIHNSDMQLAQSAKNLVGRYGAVILKNVYINSELRDMGHRNRFPQLSFHIDRNPNQDTRFSLYTRNPFDKEQKYPRTSMTLFIPYLVAFLQGLKENNSNVADKEGLITRCDLYTPTTIPELLNKIVLPHTWDEPEGTGELSIIDNGTVLHASYYPNEMEKGYRIGVRYVS